MHVCGSPTNISPNWVTQLATQAYRENLHITIKPKEMRFGWKGREDWIGGWLALGTPQVLFLLYKKRPWEIGTNQPWFTCQLSSLFTNSLVCHPNELASISICYSQLPSFSLLKSISIYNLPQLIFHSVEQMNLPPYN